MKIGYRRTKFHWCILNDTTVDGSMEWWQRTVAACLRLWIAQPKSGVDGNEENDGMLILLIGTVKYPVEWSM